eukprot:9383445-Pyramimonas_sp.AAC.2
MSANTIRQTNESDVHTETHDANQSPWTRRQQPSPSCVTEQPRDGFAVETPSLRQTGSRSRRSLYSWAATILLLTQSKRQENEHQPVSLSDHMGTS